ncbi:MAG TPA: hypothetical protein VG815_16950 [Chloroflexota bacterium]|jgi:hypothetical protein|nr:hypothetical protein [Chloroflexota bacterium]
MIRKMTKKGTKKVKVHKVKLARDAVAHVVVPRGTVPVVMTEDANAVKIVPVKEELARDKTWWERFIHGPWYDVPI